MTAPSAAAQSGVPQTPASATSAPRAPYLQRGDQVEGRYKMYRERLQRLFEALGARLEKEAPETRPKITPPAPVPHGYQILPKLIPDPAPPPGRRRIVLSSFSWSRTESLIERDRTRLDSLEARLDDAVQLTGEDRLREYDKLVDEYKKLLAGQKLIESTIQYN